MSEKYPEGAISRKRIIQEGRGIRLNNLYYWTDTLRDMIGRQILIRYDPRDLSTITARVGRQWIECKAQWMPRGAGRSEGELQEWFKALSERRRRSKGAAKDWAELLATSAQGEINQRSRVR